MFQMSKESGDAEESVQLPGTSSSMSILAVGQQWFGLYMSQVAWVPGYILIEVDEVEFDLFKAGYNIF